MSSFWAIATVHSCILQLALGCDLRSARPDSVTTADSSSSRRRIFSVPFVRHATNHMRRKPRLPATPFPGPGRRRPRPCPCPSSDSDAQRSLPPDLKFPLIIRAPSPPVCASFCSPIDATSWSRLLDSLLEVETPTPTPTPTLALALQPARTTPHDPRYRACCLPRSTQRDPYPPKLRVNTTPHQTSIISTTCLASAHIYAPLVSSPISLGSLLNPHALSLNPSRRLATLA